MNELITTFVYQLKSIQFQLFDIDLSLWDIQIGIILIGLIGLIFKFIILPNIE